MKDSFRDSEDQPWPPSAPYSKADNIPDVMNHFMSYLLAGKDPRKPLRM